MGFGCHALRRVDPAGGWLVRFHTLPGPRAVRAASAAPIYFRRGDPSLARGSETLASDRKKGELRTGVALAFDFWASVPVCGPLAVALALALSFASCARGGLRSCLGLCLSQGFGHDQPCTAMGFDPACFRGFFILEAPWFSNRRGSPASGRLSPLALAARRPIRSWASVRPSRIDSHRRNVRQPRITRAIARIAIGTASGPSAFSRG